MPSVFDSTRKQVEDNQNDRSSMLQGMSMPEEAVDAFAGKSVEELKEVDMKKLSPTQAKQWAAAMEAAEEVAKMPAPAPNSGAAPAPASSAIGSDNGSVGSAGMALPSSPTAY